MAAIFVLAGMFFLQIAVGDAGKPDDVMELKTTVMMMQKQMLDLQQTVEEYKATSEAQETKLSEYRATQHIQAKHLAQLTNMLLNNKKKIQNQNVNRKDITNDKMKSTNATIDELELRVESLEIGMLDVQVRSKYCIGHGVLLSKGCYFKGGSYF